MDKVQAVKSCDLPVAQMVVLQMYNGFIVLIHVYNPGGLHWSRQFNTLSAALEYYAEQVAFYS